MSKRIVSFEAPPWWDEFLKLICGTRPPQPPDPNLPVDPKTWQLGITVTPAEASVRIIDANGRASARGVREGTSAHYLIQMSAPPFEVDAIARLVIEAAGYLTYDAALLINPDMAKELPAATLEMVTQSWQLGVTVTPADAVTFVDSGEQRVSGEADGSGGHKLLKFSTPTFVPNAQGSLTVQAPGYASSVQTLASIGPDTTLELPAVTLTKAATLVPLRINGKFFEKMDGTPFTRIACSDFGLIRLLHEGQDIVPILRERVAMGFNEVRVFSMMCGTLGRLLPNEIPDYYTQLLPQFLTLAEAEGLRVELTSLVDANGDSSNGAHWPHDLRISHHEQCLAVLRSRTDSPHFSERVNENDQLMNATPIDGFSRPWGVYSCSGSYGADVIPGQHCEQWDYGTLHPARPPDWVRKVVHNVMEDIADRHGIPGTSNEICRPNQGRGPIQSDWFEAGAGSSLLHNGSCFHGEVGKFSRLYAHDDVERGCAEAYIAGVLAVPLNYRYGQYMAGHLHDMPIESHPTSGEDPLVWNSRCYARNLDDGRSCAVVIQPNEHFVARALPGWTIVSQNQSVFFCERVTKKGKRKA